MCAVIGPTTLRPQDAYLRNLHRKDARLDDDLGRLHLNKSTSYHTRSLAPRQSDMLCMTPTKPEAFIEEMEPPRREHIPTSVPAGYRWRLSSMLWPRFAIVSAFRSVISIEAGLPCTAAEIPLQHEHVTGRVTEQPIGK